jgi:hypothetical protein
MNIKQKKILHLLTIINGRRYSDLYKNFTEDDKFPYHLKYLINKGFINKRDNCYFLTREGAYATEQFESSTLQDRKLSIPIFHFICNYHEKFLVRKAFSADIECHHLYAIPGIKAEWGLKNDELFHARLAEKLGVEGTVKYRSTCHLLEYTSKNQVMWDDLIIVFDVDVTNIIKEKSAMSWYTLEEIAQLPNRHEPVDVFILKDNREPYLEILMKDNFNLRDEDL